MAIKVVDRGAEQLLADMGGSFTVRVGILGSKSKKSKKSGGGSGSANDGITVADVARWAELGIGQPQRSWLRGWFDNNEALIEDRIRKEMKRMVEGKQDRAMTIKRLGVWLQGELQLNIANFPDNGLLPNAPKTIEKKGSSVPLINTGQLRSSIAHKTKDNKRKK